MAVTPINAEQPNYVASVTSIIGPPYTASSPPTYKVPSAIIFIDGGQPPKGIGYGIVAQAETVAIKGVGGGTGVYGTGSRFGVYGTATDTDGIGIVGKQSRGKLAAQFRGDVQVEGGQFRGDVVVEGDLRHELVAGSNKYKFHYSANLNGYFEDFGLDNIVDGNQSHTKIIPWNADFKAMVDFSQPFLIFLTPYGDCMGLYVEHQDQNGFTVKELQNGTSTVEFAYRVVAQRNDITVNRTTMLEGRADERTRARATPRARPKKRARVAK